METDISRRLIGASAILSEERKVIDVDISGIVRRLLLFDKYVLVSIRLQEFPLLVGYLGYEGLRDLLAEKLIEIRCECLQLSQTAQSGILGDPVLPPFSYRFHWIDAHDRRNYIHDCLQCLQSSGLQHKQVLKLKRAVVNAIRRLPEDTRSQLYPAFEHELLHNAGLKDRVAGLRAKAGLMMASPAGKTMRFLLTTGIGIIPHALVPATALSIFDNFLVDKLLPRSGIAAFINELYPSIFDSHKES